MDLDVDIIYKKFMCLASWSSAMLWSRGDIVFDQYAVPSLCTTKYFAPLIL